MVKAITIGCSVLVGILIGRIQTVENHDANEALVASERAEKRAVAAKRDAIRTKALLDSTEKKVISMWSRLEPMLEDFTRAEGLIDRDSARRRIEVLRWEMSTVNARIIAAREAAGDDERTAMRQAYIITASF